MIYEEKLDFILRKLPENYDLLSDSEVMNIYNLSEINPNEKSDLVAILKGDGFVATQIITRKVISGGLWVITYKGKIFLEKGGYVGKLKSETRIQELAEKTYRKTIVNTNWVIVGAIAAMIGVIVSIIIYKISQNSLPR